jgi:hypothetical protein
LLVVVFLLVGVAEEGCVVVDSFDGHGFFFLGDADVKAEADSSLHEERVGFRWWIKLLLLGTTRVDAVR